MNPPPKVGERVIYRGVGRLAGALAVVEHVAGPVTFRAPPLVTIRLIEPAAVAGGVVKVGAQFLRLEVEPPPTEPDEPRTQHARRARPHRGPAGSSSGRPSAGGTGARYSANQ